MRQRTAVSGGNARLGARANAARGWLAIAALAMVTLALAHCENRHADGDRSPSAAQVDAGQASVADGGNATPNQPDSGPADGGTAMAHTDAGGDAPGACRSAEDEAILMTADLDAATERCARRDPSADAVARCLVDEVRLSPDCAQCFGENVACTVQYCLRPCTFDPDACDPCRREKGCVAAYERCSGLSEG